MAKFVNLVGLLAATAKANSKGFVPGKSFRYPEGAEVAKELHAPNPDFKYYCPYPEKDFPGSGWMSISERADQAEYVVYAKAVEKVVTSTSLYGQEYDVKWSLECNTLSGNSLPQTFWMTGLGRYGPDYIPCGPRNVVTGFNYVFFAQNYNPSTGYLELNEYNNQEGLFRIETDMEARRELAPWLNECVANFCHDDTDISDDWQPMPLADRIQAAEYAFEVHMTDATTGCIQCVLNEPADDNRIEHVYKVNETVKIGQGSMHCHDYSNVGGSRYIALFQSVDINGVVLPDGELHPDEVNGQVAIVEADNQIQSDLASLLRNCPAVDYVCPAEDPAPTPDSSVTIVTTIFLVFLVNLIA